LEVERESDPASLQPWKRLRRSPDHDFTVTPALRCSDSNPVPPVPATSTRALVLPVTTTLGLARLIQCYLVMRRNF